MAGGRKCQKYHSATALGGGALQLSSVHYRYYQCSTSYMRWHNTIAPTAVAAKKKILLKEEKIQNFQKQKKKSEIQEKKSPYSSRIPKTQFTKIRIHKIHQNIES